MKALGENGWLVFQDLLRVWEKVRTGVMALEQAEWMYSLGTKLSLDQDVDAWRVQWATLAGSPVFGTLGCLCRVADLGSH